MKNIIKSISLLLVASIFIFTNTANAQSKKISKDVEITFSVDIDCPSCKKKLEDKLPFEAGVKDLKINLEERTIWMKYDSSKTDKVKLAKAIEKLGYAAKEIEGKK
ncbi:MAG: copper chaperone [Bacteroidia bacterium]|jgi:copper chaperone CopZ|nr:copper chaperone [Bacteroidia bacterium]